VPTPYFAGNEKTVILCTFQRFFGTRPEEVNEVRDVDIDGIARELSTQVNHWNSRWNGFVIEHVRNFVICITKFRPLHDSSYIPTPKRIVNKHCTVNVQNNDQKCFVWSVVDSLYPASDHVSKLYKYFPYEHFTKHQQFEFSLSSSRHCRVSNWPVYSGPDLMSVFYDHVMNESKLSAKFLKITRTYFRSQTNNKPSSMWQHTVRPAVQILVRNATTLVTTVTSAAIFCFLYVTTAIYSWKLQAAKNAAVSRNCNNKKAKLETDEDFFLPVVFHNLKSYDAHFVIKHFKKEYTERKKADGKPSTYYDVVVTPLNSEEYVMHQVSKLRFFKIIFNSCQHPWKIWCPFF